jgi:hypothetical protein
MKLCRPFHYGAAIATMVEAGHTDLVYANLRVLRLACTAIRDAGDPARAAQIEEAFEAYIIELAWALASPETQKIYQRTG